MIDVYEAVPSETQGISNTVINYNSHKLSK